MLNMTVNFDTLKKRLSREYKKGYDAGRISATKTTVKKISSLIKQTVGRTHVHLALWFGENEMRVIGVFSTRVGANRCILNTSKRVGKTIDNFGVITQKLRPV